MKKNGSSSFHLNVTNAFKEALQDNIFHSLTYFPADSAHGCGMKDVQRRGLVTIRAMKNIEMSQKGTT
jgi:hypothetical protein